MRKISITRDIGSLMKYSWKDSHYGNGHQEIQSGDPALETGNGALFTREDAVEAAWAAVDPVLKTHHRAYTYKPGSWGPEQADALIAADGSWHNPIPGKAVK